MVYVQNGREINVRTTSDGIELPVPSLLPCSHSAVHVCSGGLQDRMERDLRSRLGFREADALDSSELQVAVDLCFVCS